MFRYFIASIASRLIEFDLFFYLGLDNILTTIRDFESCTLLGLEVFLLRLKTVSPILDVDSERECLRGSNLALTGSSEIEHEELR